MTFLVGGISIIENVISLISEGGDSGLQMNSILEWAHSTSICTVIQKNLNVIKTLNSMS